VSPLSPRQVAHRALGFFVAALLARLVAAAASGLYVDEAFVYFMSRLDLGQIVGAARPDNNPPLWYFVLHPLARITRDGLLLRLPSSVMGTLAAPLTYLAGRTQGERVGLVSGALAAVAYTSWLVDAQTRAYGLLAALCALVLATTLEAPREPLPPWRWAVLAGASVALPLLHLVGWLVDLAMLAASLLPGTPSRWRRAACFALGVASGAAWMAYAAAGAASALHGHQRHPSQLAEMALLPSTLTGLSMPFHWSWLRPTDLAPAGSLVVSLLVGAAAVHGLIVIGRTRPRAAATLALYAGVPLCGIAAGAMMGLQSYQNRYLVPVAGAIFVALAASANTCFASGEPARPRHGVRLLGTALCAGAVGVNLVTLACFPFDRYLHNQDWRQAAAWIEHRELEGDVLVACVPYSLVGLDFYDHAPDVDVDFSTPATMQLRFSPKYRGAEQMAVPPGLLDPGLAARLRGRHVFLLLNQVDDATRQRALEVFREGWLLADTLALDSLAGWGRIEVYALVPKGG